jgi:RNA recognition motif-containing protein
MSQASGQAFSLEPTSFRAWQTDWWADESRKLFVGNIPAGFKESRVWEELGTYGINPMRMKLRQGDASKDTSA